jgi:hypothetical protein
VSNSIEVLIMINLTKVIFISSFLHPSSLYTYQAHLNLYHISDTSSFRSTFSACIFFCILATPHFGLHSVRTR